MRARVRWVMLVLACAVAGCEGGAGDVDGGARVDSGARVDASGDTDAGRSDAMVVDASSDAQTADAGLDSGEDSGTPAVELDAGTDAGADAGPPDAGERVLRVRVLADGACSGLAFDPPSISVPAGTSFTVEWINATGCTDIDIDMGGTVPIVIGLEPGMRYHDTIREWCGSFTGTYVFRAYYSPSFPAYLDVDCSS